MFAGEEAQFELHLNNRTRLDRYAVWLGFQANGEPRQATDVPAGGGSAVRLSAASIERGWLAAPRVRLVTRFPLGLFRAWSYWRPDLKVLVYPAPETPAQPLPSSGAASEDGHGTVGLENFAGIRSYQPGDPMRHLAWRQIARHDPALGGQLVTKHFDGGRGGRAVPRFRRDAAADGPGTKTVAHDALGAGGRAARPALHLPPGAARVRPGAGRRPPGGLPARAGAVRARAMMSWFSHLPRDKSDTLLLLAAALMVLAPHFEHLPAWITAAVAARCCGAPRSPGAASACRPSGCCCRCRWRRWPASGAATHTLLGRDAGVAMLALLLAFKLLEMRAKRDLFVVVFLSFFVLLTNFFYSQTMLTALCMGATLIVLLTAQISFQYTGAVPPLARRLRTATRIAVLAAPLAVLMFFGFPRIQGPLWGLPGDAHTGHTGISDSMAPGTLSSLAQSEAVAFRARFLDDPAPPPKRLLYWRSIVLGDYDGRTWTRVPRRRGQLRQEIAIATRGRPVRLQVTLEPGNTRWLAALELSGPELKLPGYRVRDSDELEFFTTDPVTQRVRYEATAWTDFSIQADDDPAAHGALDRAAGRLQPAHLGPGAPASPCRCRSRLRCAAAAAAGRRHGRPRAAAAAALPRRRLQLHAAAAVAGPRRRRRLPL